MQAIQLIINEAAPELHQMILKSDDTETLK
jgi:hypothetical protein